MLIRFESVDTIMLEAVGRLLLHDYTLETINLSMLSSPFNPGRLLERYSRLKYRDAFPAANTTTRDLLNWLSVPSLDWNLRHILPRPPKDDLVRRLAGSYSRFCSNFNCADFHCHTHGKYDSFSC